MKEVELDFQECTLLSRSEVKEASDGRKYFTARVSPGFGLLASSRNFWQQFRKDKNGLPTKETYWERATPEQADSLINSGKSFLAAKVTAKVKPYSIGEGEAAREVNTYSCIIFKDEDVINVFASANHPILNEATGELIGEKAPKKAILATKEAAAKTELADVEA